MDIQGSQYHLLNGRADWAGCTDVALGLTLEEAGAIDPESGPVPELSGQSSTWQFDADQLWLRLRRDTPLFRQAGRIEPLDPALRRGAGRDGYGTWFWVDDDGRGILWRPAADGAASPWWSVDDLHAGCGCAGSAGSAGNDGASPGSFGPVAPCPAVGAQLSGLTVTTHHILVVGYTGDGGNGLLLFDLQAGGDPSRLVWPADEPFTPLDLADCDDGGVLVLDAEHSRYWRLDEHFRVRGVRRSRTGTFAGADGTPALQYPQPAGTAAHPLTGPDGTPLHPLAIEPGPGGSVLLLESDPSVGYSVLSCFDGDVPRWTTPLRDVVEVIDPADPDNVSTLYSLLGHDLTYVSGPPATGPLAPPMLYVADAAGNQVVAFALDADTGSLTAQDDFLPLRRWAGRGLVRAGDGAWYDFGTRWVPLAVFTQCRFASQATLVTAAPTGELPGEMFDSSVPGCVWHRLLLDAWLPTQTAVTVRARAADDVALLPESPWLEQPLPYLRGNGSELPWADPWADHRDTAGALPHGMGTYELLLQHVVGRYAQLEITLSGGGRSSATVRSVRTWFPRFSYVEHYLPAVYAEADTSQTFLERFLANPEGLLTALEEQIEHSHLLLDPRTARAGDLPWLASWFGLVLDPLWTTQRRRFLIRNVDAFYRRRGTVAGLLAMLRVFFDPQVDAATIFRVGAVPATTSRLRLVERFLTRAGFTGHGADSVRASSHRFEVQVPGNLDEEQVAMVRRIVDQARPAHTAYTLTAYEELFVIGTARLGLDTELAGHLRFTPVVLGAGRLGRGLLAADRPFDLTDRLVSDRDRIDALPALQP